MSSDSPVCLHRILEGNIHEFTLTESSRRVVDEFYILLDNINREIVNSGTDQHLCLLVDAVKGLPPLNYGFTHMRPLGQKYPQQKASVAMISDPNFLLTTINFMMRAVSPIRFFKPDERDQALAWLHDQRSARR